MIRSVLNPEESDTNSNSKNNSNSNNIQSNTDNTNNTNNTNNTSPYRRSSQISALLNNPTDISPAIKNEDRNYTISSLNNLSSSLNNSTIHTQSSQQTQISNNDGIVKQRRKSSVYDENGNRTQALLSTSSPEGIAAASMVTPNRIAKLLKEKGSMPIRDITSAMVVFLKKLVGVNGLQNKNLKKLF
ncbi:unnamed protein product [[Candida] boidinii]|nr:unnamed protein product [[Candida] boidinii]